MDWTLRLWPPELLANICQRHFPNSPGLLFVFCAFFQQFVNTIYYFLFVLAHCYGQYFVGTRLRVKVLYLPA